MWIMNLVWPITALYCGPFAIWAEIVRGNKSVTIGWAHDGQQRLQMFPILELK